MAWMSDQWKRLSNPVGGLISRVWSFNIMHFNYTLDRYSHDLSWKKNVQRVTEDGGELLEDMVNTEMAELQEGYDQRRNKTQVQRARAD